MKSDALRRAATRLLPAMLASVALAGCNHYELFSLAGYEQASFQNAADVLFIGDNSPSMEQEGAALGLNFQVFIHALANPATGASSGTPLSNAVGDYVDYTSDPGSVLDYQLGVTTTTVDPSRGDPTALDPGEAGTLIGPVLARGEGNVQAGFLGQFLCQTVNWNESDLVPEDPAWACGDAALPTEMSVEYLDCLCGEGTWNDNQGSGTEQPLEAALLAMCRASADPPEDCYHTYHGTPTETDTGVVDDIDTFGPSDVGTNAGMFREGSTAVVVIVTDEGDNSTQFLATGDDDASYYLNAYAQFPWTTRFAVIGPRYDAENLHASACSIANDGTRSDVAFWSVDRLYQAASSTGGFYADITTGGETDCDVADFATYLQRLGDLLNNLVNAFPLKSIPDASTIRVFVNGDEISESSVDSSSGQSIYTDGWSYAADQNAVVFWGGAVPDYNANVEIYYRPLEGKPRDLPF